MGGRRVVVTGLGAYTPLGNSVPEFWKNLLNGKSGADYITLFDASKFKTQFACEVKGFDADELFGRKEARKLDRYAQFAVAAADQCLTDSGFDLEKINSNRIGVILGSGVGGLKTLQEATQEYFLGDGTPRFNPFFIPKMISDIAAGYLSIRYGFRGPNYTTVAACASATTAIIDAFNYIKFNKADAMLTGGSEATVWEAGIGGFNAMKALSTRNDSPKTASRPFDKDRDGFVLGEGGCILMIEELEHAKARGAKIYAEIAGGGLSADAYHITAPHPEGLGAKIVMKTTLEDAEMNPEDIDYINVHGTSTQLGDIAETAAIKSVFGDASYMLNISSTKSMTGHMLGAAGACEAMACILSVQNDIVPPTINHFTDDPALDNKLNFTFNKAQERVVNTALSNTFGFGGHNASVIVKKYH